MCKVMMLVLSTKYSSYQNGRKVGKTILFKDGTFADKWAEFHTPTRSLFNILSASY